MSYQTVIGLEVHIQLSTQRKVFAPENFVFGSQPNHHVSPVSMAHPGSLPSPNLLCLRHIVKLGLAIGCKIARYSYFSRKNYFYPDLPKGYQLSQDTLPICGEGKFQIRLGDNSLKEIGIERIHLEEDAGKSVHDINPTYTLIDLNRAGVGLAELVTKPDLRSAEEAGALLAEIRRLVRYLQISDGNMEEGSLRCDANVSVMPKGSGQYGTRVEIKNINSISQVIKAITYESSRQIQSLEQGIAIQQETRTWDVAKGITSPMRDKETADDYRYFPEPDMQPVAIEEEELEKIAQEIPRLAPERLAQYTQEYKIPINEAAILSDQREFSDYFEELVLHTGTAKQSANWVLGVVRSYLNEHNMEIGEFPLSPKRLSELIALVREQKITLNAAKEIVFPQLCLKKDALALEVAKAHDLLVKSQKNELEEAMYSLIEKFPAETKKYKSGKKNLAGFFVGQLMRHFKGKANPKEVNEVVRKVLDMS